VVESPCEKLDDCGGIYTSFANTGNEIKRNIITHLAGYTEGAPAHFGAYALYIDSQTEGTTLDSNTVYDCEGGIKTHSAVRNNIIRDNVVFSTEMQAVLFSQSDVPPTGDIMDNLFKGNVIFPMAPESPCLEIRSSTDHTDFGEFDNNYYFNPFSEYEFVRTSEPGDLSNNAPNASEPKPALFETFNLHDWKMATGWDANSQDAFFREKYYQPEAVSDVNVIANSTFTGTTNGWGIWSPGGDHAGALSVENNGLKVNYRGDSQVAYLTSNLNGAVTPGYYLLRYEMQSAKNAAASFQITRLSPYERLSNIIYITGSELGTKHEALVKVHTASSFPRIEMACSKETGAFYLDNVELYRLDLEKPDLDTIASLMINDSESPLTIDLQGKTYLDVDSGLVEGSIELPPFSSKVLINKRKFTTSVDNISQRDLRNKFLLYPNPASNLLFIKSRKADISEVVISDLSGRILKKVTGSDFTESINVSDLVSGLYVVRVKDNNGKVYNQKVIKE